MITVLMTVYNGGEYLHTSIKSILNQTYKDFELLIINDCSQDHSAKVIETYGDPRIRVIENQENLGQTRSLNKGLSLAKGRYIARMDADDQAFPRWLEKCLTVLKSNSSLAVVSCKAFVVNEKNQVYKILNTPERYEHMILRSFFATPLNHVGSVYKADVIASFGGYDESLKIAADYALWSKLLRAKVRLWCLSEPLVAIRVHELSISMQERGRGDFSEISKVMNENIKKFVSLDITAEETQQLWKLNYETENLSADEFIAATVTLDKIYNNLNSSLDLLDRDVRAFLNQQKKIFYAKRILESMEKGHVHQLRVLSAQYCHNRGWRNIFTMLWLFSWFAMPVLKNIPRIFHQWKGWRAQRQYQRWNPLQLNLN